MNAYLDASVLVALLTLDSLAVRADQYLRLIKPVLIVSDFASAEFVSAIARCVRTKELAKDEANASFSKLDIFIARSTVKVETTTIDIKSAEQFIRRLDAPLRAPDAIHIAVSRRLNASLLTFDRKMRDAARSLGVDAPLL